MGLTSLVHPSIGNRESESGRASEFLVIPNLANQKLKVQTQLRNIRIRLKIHRLQQILSNHIEP